MAWRIPVLLVVIVLFLPAPAAARIMAQEIQGCASNADCTLVPQTCSRACGTLPVLKSMEQAYLQKRLRECGEGVSDLPRCNMNPPLNAVCVNNRCTLDYAFQHNAHAGDFRNKGLQGPPED